MSLIELLVVWGWHLPAARAFAAGTAAGLFLEQAMFLMAGLLLWSACLGTRDSGDSARRGAGIIALLLTTMHMTLLGALIALAPRTLFGTTGFTCFGVTLSPLVDQHQIGRAHVGTLVTNAHLVCRLLLETQISSPPNTPF